MNPNFLYFNDKYVLIGLLATLLFVAFSINGKAQNRGVSFEFETTMLERDTADFPIDYDTIGGKVFLDLDVNGALSSKDAGQGAIEVWCYQDRDLDGEIDYDSDPRLFSGLTNLNGDYEFRAYYPEVQSVKSDITSNNEDAAEDFLNGAISLSKSTLKSVIRDVLPKQVIDTVSTWKYYDAGDIADSTWSDLSYTETGWSTGTADFGFGDAGITTTVASGNYTYYYRKSFVGGDSASTWNAATIKIKRDDGAVIYLNGEEIARSNMPSGDVLYNTLAINSVEGDEESEFIEIEVEGLSFNTGTNVLAVEIHQDDTSSTDLHFDLMMSTHVTYTADVGLRFSNVDVPQGALIIDAFLRLTSAETVEDTALITIEGEASDNAAAFVNTTNNITARSRTTANATWSNSKAFIVDREVKIEGLKNVIQEISDRAGWSSGNNMALFISGFENEFYAFNGGTAPELTISYLDTSQTSIQYIVTVDTVDLPEEYTFMTDEAHVVTVDSGEAPISYIDFGYIGSTSMCVAASDSTYDALHIINRFSGKNKKIGAFGTSTEIEAISLSRYSDSLYAVDGDSFGLVDLSYGTFTSYGNTIGTADGADGAQVLDDIDGLAFDLKRNVLWASHRRNGANDLLFLIDVATGQFVPDAFGTGVDYVVASGGGLLSNLDDIAVNPNTGKILGMNNNNGGTTNLVEIDAFSGTSTVINGTGLNDMEGQSFHNDGMLYSTSGKLGTLDNAFYQVDTSNSQLTLIGIFESEGDFEGCDCKSGSSVNFIDGYVFEDVDGDSLFTDADLVSSDVEVWLYSDSDSNDTYSVGDVLLDSKVTDENGHYAFGITSVGDYFIIVNTSDIPLEAQLITTENYNAKFGVNGQVQLGNDFGYRKSSELLPVEVTHFSGEHKSQQNHLYWTTASEVNNDYFNVQRSKDAIHFETIGIVNGAGNTNEISNYSFIDEQPYDGVNYYRLQQVDFDGANELSKIIHLETKSTTEEQSVVLNVYPNPSHRIVKIDGLKKLSVFEDVSLVVFDINGVEQYTNTFSIENDVIEMDISGYKDGMYFVQLTSITNGLLQSMSFIKQDK